LKGFFYDLMINLVSCMFIKFIMNTSKLIISIAFLTLISCGTPSAKKQAALYERQCASCHLAPSIAHLPKDIWATKILPDMGARMGMKDSTFNPLGSVSYEEATAIFKTGIYPVRPTMVEKDWKLLKEYIISMAPDSLISIDNENTSTELDQFIPKPISFDTNQGSFITYLKYTQENNNILIGNIQGNLSAYNFIKDQISTVKEFSSAVVDYTKKEHLSYTTIIGKLDPSEIPSGKIVSIKNDTVRIIPKIFHRPVHNLVIDLNKDGTNELVISEFGNLTGKLSLLYLNDNMSYDKKILLNQPGTIRVLSKDMNKDGKEDLIALTSQGDETITILYQQDNLSFIPEKVLQFSPVYGTSWFELIDYDDDGDDDIITVNGDNADKSYVQKPYHGMRIHINDGSNNFKEAYFYPLNGATRLIARDFDQDGDVDFGLLSTFPDYEKHPEFSFVYLENENASAFNFKPYTFKDSNTGRWFLMDAGDVDNDGDEDIILSSFTYIFTPVPAHLSKLWNEKNVDIMILENTLK